MAQIMSDRPAGFGRGEQDDAARRAASPTTRRSRVPIAIAAVLVVTLIGLLAALARLAMR